MCSSGMVVAFAEVFAPVVMLEDLVDEEHTPPAFVKLASKLVDASPLEIEVVQVDVEALTVVDVEVLFRILQKEGGLAHTPGAFDAYHPRAPVDLVHQYTTDGSIGVLDKISVCAKKGFHLLVCFSLV